MKRLLLLALLVPVGAHAAVAFTFKVSGQSSTNTVSATTLTTSGASLIVIHVGWVDNVTNTVSGITVGGSAATLAVRKATASNFHGSELWTYWSSGALSSVTVTATFASAGAPFSAIQVTEATGTDSSSAGAVCSGTDCGSSTTGVTSGTAAATTTVNSSVVICGFATDFAGGTAGTNTIELNDRADGNGDGYYMDNNTQATTSGTKYTCTETWTSGAYAGTALEIKPSGGGGGATCVPELAALGAGGC